MSEEIYKVDSSNAELVSAAALENVGIPGFFITLDTETMDGKIAYTNACNDAESLADHEGEVIHMTDAFIVPGYRRDRNGGPSRPCANTYVIDADGMAYFSQSDGVARSLTQIHGICPNLDGGNGYLPIAVKSKKLANGNTIKSIVIIKE